MSPAASTPVAVLFDIMKRHGGVSNRELATMILSGRPLADGHSPQSRVEDRTWLSRFVVHAPDASLGDHLFCDYTAGALRLAARLSSARRSSRGRSDVMAAVFGKEGRAMDRALEAAGQDATVYRNLMERIRQEESLSETERAEAALVLMITAACTADVGRAAAETQGFAFSMFGSGLMTPPPAADALALRQEAFDAATAPWLGLLRLEGSLVVGEPHWVAPSEEGTQIGALALGEGAVSKVGPDVSGLHARLWCDDAGRWWVEGLGSRNGTVLVSGLTGEEMTVEPPAAERREWQAVPVEVAPGDQLRLGQSTTFVLIEGLPG